MSDEKKERARERHILVETIPELRIAVLDTYTRSLRLLAGLGGERLGKTENDVAVRVFAGAMVGVALAVLDLGAQESLADIGELLDEALAMLEAGLPL